MWKKLIIYFATLGSSACFFVIFVLIFMNSTEIGCSKQLNGMFTCTTRTLLFGKLTTSGRETTQIVDVNIFDDGCSDGCSYRAEFITSDERRIPVNEVYTDYNPVAKRVEDLKRQMNSGEASFEYIIEPSWWVLYLLGGLFLMEAVIVTLTIGVGAVREYLMKRDTVLP
jgi:hypothetical protein